MNMKKLLVIADASAVHTERWCRYFIDKGVEVALFSLEPKTISFTGRFIQGTRPTGVGAFDYLLALPKYKAILKEFQPDIVNPHYVVSYGWIASFFRQCPIVATAWGSDLLLLPQKSVVHRMRISRALKKADYCTVDNQNLSDAAAKFTTKDKIVRVLMGVDRAFFESGEKTEFPQKGCIRIIAPRGLQQVYDPRTIVAAVELLKDKANIKLDLLGDEPEATTISAEIKKRAVSDLISVRPLLKHREFVSSLKNYDIYLSASLSDSTSVALLEAMTVGLFPVVSSIEGNREWITDGVNGVMFEPGSFQSLADTLPRAMAMQNQFGEVAKDNRNRVEKEAIWEDNMDQVRNLFLRLAK
jgi:glycosyltransferase involved in cell wall biosynthesis